MISSERDMLCVGLICVDLMAYCNEYPTEDTENVCLAQRWQRGGNASNNSTVLSLLGAKCECIGALAEDCLETRFLVEDFQKYGIKIENCPRRLNSKPPLSVGIVNKQNGSRTILHYPGELEPLTGQEFKQAVNLAKNTYKWIHFEGRPNSADVKECLQYIHDYNSQVDVENKIKTSVELEKTRPQLDLLLDMAEYVFVSKDYARYHGYSDSESAVEGISTKCREGATVICAWAEMGASARTPSGAIVKSPAFPPERLVDTLGAGDTFNAATIFSLNKKCSIKDAITFGCKVAGAKCGINGYDGIRDIHF